MNRAEAEVRLQDEGVSPSMATALMSAIETIATTSAGRVSLRALVDESDVEVGIARQALFALLESGVFYAKFEPQHPVCGGVVGPVELSESRVLQKMDDDEYGATCQVCHNYLDDIVVRIQFWLSRGYEP